MIANREQSNEKSGHIINVSSVNGHKVWPTSAVYGATKSAVRALSEGLRQEVKPYNLRTTIVSPGAVDTELLNHISDKELEGNIRQNVKDFTLPAQSFARVVAFAISQPEGMDVNEILFRPTPQPI